MLSKRQRLIKLVTLVPAIAAGLLFNYFVTMNLNGNLSVNGAFRSISFLAAQIIFFYYLINLVVFRGKSWTRGERSIALVAYGAFLCIGLVFRGLMVTVNLSQIVTWYSLQRIELNPFSFIKDFLVDRSSIVIAGINAVLFIPIPILLAWNGLKPSIRKLIACALGLEVMQYVFQQGVFSVSDMLLYSAGFTVGLILLNGYRSISKKENLRHDSAVLDQ